MHVILQGTKFEQIELSPGEKHYLMTENLRRIIGEDKLKELKQRLWKENKNG